MIAKLGLVVYLFIYFFFGGVYDRKVAGLCPKLLQNWRRNGQKTRDGTIELCLLNLNGLIEVIDEVRLTETNPLVMSRAPWFTQGRR